MRLSPLVFLYEIDADTSEPSSPPRPENAIALPLIKSAAFGDGTHPTTRLCASALDHHCRLNHPRSVLDVGTGTGVLARIARLRGAHRIVATDISPEALAAAQLNASLDQHHVRIEFSNQTPDSWGDCFDLVIANILEEPLRELSASLVAALAPGGVLMLSGFTPLQVPALEVAFSRFDLALKIQSTLDGWVLLSFEKRKSLS